MSQTRNSDIQKRILEETKIQASIENIPVELADKILPVLNVNPKSRKKLILYKDHDTGNLANVGLYVPAGKKWRIVCMFAKLVADATVTDRRIIIDAFADGTSGNDSWIWEGIAKTIQPASKTGYYSFLKNMSDAVIADQSNDQNFSVNIPDELILFEGANLWDTSINIQAGDTLMWNILIEEQDLLADEFEAKNI